MTAVVTYLTNNIWAFCLEHLGDADDDTKRSFIDWNIDWFNYNGPTCWLPVGRPFNIAPPAHFTGGLLTIQGRILVFGQDHPHSLILPNAFRPE